MGALRCAPLAGEQRLANSARSRQKWAWSLSFANVILKLMRFIARLAAGALLLATSLSTVAQPMVWQHKVDSSINAELGRDDQGNLYFAYPTRDLLNSYLKMDKLDANGRLIWSKTIDQVDVTQNKHVVKQVIFAHDRAYVLHDFETPTNDLVMSKVQEVDVVEGVSAVITATDTARYVKMAMHKKGFVVSRFAPPGVIDGVAGIQWFDLNSHLVGEQSMVGYSGVAGIACTADGKSAFIAAKSSTPSIQSCAFLSERRHPSPTMGSRSRKSKMKHPLSLS
ncbi:MAG: hypothetical protein IT363_07930 [Methanoregulaceae archaeon]|nr:hypothetical protein [Methanoregulaceae archaeon]